MSKQSNQRADVKNPNNPAQKTDQDNTANQKNPNHTPTKGNQSNSGNQVPKKEK